MSNTNDSDHFRAFEGTRFNSVCYKWGRVKEDESTNMNGTKMNRIGNTRLFHKQERITKTLAGKC